MHDGILWTVKVWQETYKDIKSTIVKQLRRVLARTADDNDRHITNKLIGQSSSSPEFTVFRKYAIEAKISKLTFTHLTNYKGVTTSQALSVSSKTLLNLFDHSEHTYGNTIARMWSNGSYGTT